MKRFCLIWMILLLWPTISLSENKIAWKSIGGDFWQVNDNLFTSQIDASREFIWSGIKFSPQKVTMEMVDVQQYLESENDTFASGEKINDAGTGFSSIQYSLEEVWHTVSADIDVLAVAPLGYLEQKGIPQIAGFFKNGGETLNPIFNAKNLTALLCMDSPAFSFTHQSPPDQTEISATISPSRPQAPYLFSITYDERRPFTYLSGLSAIDPNDLSPDDLSAEDLSGLPISGQTNLSAIDLQETYLSDRILRFFESCPDMVQVGPKIVFPRKQEPVSVSNPSRKSRDVTIFEDQRPAYRTVFSWDLSGQITIITTKHPVKLEELWELVSSNEFYRGRTCSGSDPHKISLGCEYWAVVMTSFEHSGLIVRSHATEAPQFIRNTDSTIPAALIISKSRKVAPVL